MGIVIRHDAAGVPASNNKSQFAAGMQMVARQQEADNATRMANMKYYIDTQQKMQEQDFLKNQQIRGQDFQADRDKSMLQADKDAFERRLQANREDDNTRWQRDMMRQAEQQQAALILDEIKNDEYEPDVARELKQNIIDENRVLAAPDLDPVQRQEALDRLRTRRSVLRGNRKPPKAKPTPEEELNSLPKDKYGRTWQKTGKGWELLPDPVPATSNEPKAPMTAGEAFEQNPKTAEFFERLAREKITQGGENPGAASDPGLLFSTMEKIYNAWNSQFKKQPTPLSKPALAPSPAPAPAPVGTPPAANEPAAPTNSSTNAWEEILQQGKKSSEGPDAEAPKPPVFTNKSAGKSSNVDYEALRNFTAKQTPDIQKAIATASDESLSDQEREQAVRFLLENNVDLRRVGRKQRDPVGGAIPIANDADRFQPGAFGTWNQTVRNPKY